MEYVYKYEHPKDGCIYIGRTNNLLNRIKTHNYYNNDNIDRTEKDRLNECDVYYIKLGESKSLSVAVEAFLIYKYKPILNLMLNSQEENDNCFVDMVIPEWEKLENKKYRHKRKYKKKNELPKEEIDQFLIFLKSIEGKRLYADEQKVVKEEFENIGVKLRYKGINTFNGALQDVYKDAYECRFCNTNDDGKKYVDKRRNLSDGTPNPNRDKSYWILR